MNFSPNWSKDQINSARSSPDWSSDPFTVEFQNVLISVLQRYPEFARRFPQSLNEDYYDDTCRRAVRLMQNYLGRYGEMPSREHIYAQTQITLPDTTEAYAWLEREVPAFVRHKALENAVLSSVADLMAGNYDRLKEKVDEAYSIRIGGSSRSLRWASLSQILQMPVPKWLVRDLLLEGTVSLLYGPPRSFKSFVLLDLVMRSAAGMKWHDRDIVSRPVIYVAAEGEGGLSARMNAWMRKYQKDVQQSSSPLPVTVLGQAVNLMDRHAVDMLIAEAKTFEYTKPIICVDTLAASMAGGDEDRARDMVQAINSLYRIRNELDATVIAVHHTGKDTARGPRGSSSAVGNADCIIRCTPDGDGNTGTLKIEKMKDGSDGTEFEFGTEVVQIGIVPGQGIQSSLVAVECAQPSKRDPVEELRFKVACQMIPGETLGLKVICARIGKGFGSSVVGAFEKAFPFGVAFTVDTTHGERILRRIKANTHGKIECSLKE